MKTIFAHFHFETKNGGSKSEVWMHGISKDFPFHSYWFLDLTQFISSLEIQEMYLIDFKRINPI